MLIPLPARKVPFSLPKGSWSILCNQRAPAVTDWAPDLLNGSIHLLLHSNSHMHQQEPKSHTAYSSPGEGAGLVTTLTLSKTFFLERTHPFPAGADCLPAIGHLQLPYLVIAEVIPECPAMFCWGVWGVSMALADPNLCHLQQGSPLYTALGVGSGLGRNLVLEQPHLLAGSSRSRVRHKAMLGWKLWTCAAAPGSCCPLFLELQQGSWMMLPPQGRTGSQGS